MKLPDAIKRLHYTISKANKPNQNDADAFNAICEFLKKSEQKAVQENLLFAKLYTHILAEYTIHYTDIDFANKQINKLLSEPMALRVEELQSRIMQLELLNYFNQKKVLDPFLKTKNASELIEIHKRYSNKLPELNNDEFFKLQEKWNFENVKYKLETQINLSIQNAKSYV